VGRNKKCKIKWREIKRKKKREKIKEKNIF